MTVHDLHVTPSNKFTEMRSYLHELMPVTKKSILIRIEIQMQSFTEVKAAVFAR